MADVTFLDWAASIAEDTGVVQTPISEIDSLPAGTIFTVSGTVTTPGYLYVVELGDTELDVLYPQDGQLDQEPAGAQLTLPAAGTAFRAPIDGQIRVFSSPNPVAEADWAALFPGRDPMPGNSRGREDVIVVVGPGLRVRSWLIAPPKKKKPQNK
jgi:hypothetical protein